MAYHRQGRGGGGGGRRRLVASSAALSLFLILSIVVIVSNNNNNKPTYYCWAFSGRSSSRPKQIKNLLDWAASNEIKISPQIGLDSDDKTGLGWFAKSSIGDGNNDLLLTVPSSVALVVETPGSGPDDSSVVQDMLNRGARKTFEELPWFVQMSVYLLKLKYVNSNKKASSDINYQPWLDALPQGLDTPVHWTDIELDELQYNYMIGAVQRQTKQWKKHYETVKACLGGSSSSSSSRMTWDEFVWGCEMARSRAFSGTSTQAFDPKFAIFTVFLVIVYLGLSLGTLEQAANGAGVVFSVAILKDFVIPKLFAKKNYVICPVIDMANHRSLSPQGQVSFEFFGNAYSLALQSDCSVENGKQLYISYGARSNDQLLQYYGFVESDNPNDVYIMPPLREWDIAALEKACGRAVGPGRLEKLEKAGLLGSNRGNDSVGSDDDGEDGVANPEGGVVVTRSGVDPAVLQALRGLLSTDEEWNDAGQAVGNFCEPVNDGNEACARLAARTAIKSELSSKVTTPEQDEETLRRMETGKSKSIEASSQDKLAVIFRIEKKKLLMEAMRNLE